MPRLLPCLYTSRCSKNGASVTSGESDKTIGEIARSVDRIESDLLRLTGQMQVAIAPISAHAVLIASNQATLDRINTHLESTDARIEGIQNKSAYIAGLI